MKLDFRTIPLLLIIISLQSCDSGEIYSFDELIELRLADDQRVNGKTVAISSNLRSDLVSFTCPGSGNCVLDLSTEDLSTYTIVNDYGNSENRLGGCPPLSIKMVSNDNQYLETLRINYGNYSGDATVPVDSDQRAIFYAEVQYIDAIDYCEKVIYKGMNIRLPENYYDEIIGLFAD